MKRFALILAVLLLASPVFAEIVVPACRVSVCDGPVQGGMSYSYGSGVLWSQSEDSNYVLTNHHVVRDGKGEVTVTYTKSEPIRATVVAIDPFWDLAVLKTRRGSVPPLPAMESDPQEGETLIAAGFGPSGSWQAIQGRVVGFVAPSEHSREYDTFEISGEVRQGDSGGPVVTEDGRLAGILWGSANGKTCGTPVSKVVALCQRYRLPCGPCQGGVCYPQQPQRPGRVVEEMPPNYQKPQQQACKCDPTISSRLVKIEQLVVELAALSKTPGPQGERGPAGENGKDAVIDYDKLAAIVATKIEHDMPKQDVDVLVTEVIRRLPPSPVYFDLKPRTKVK